MTDEPKKPEPKPSLGAMQLLGLAAALAPSVEKKDKIPDGFECTTCRGRAAHTASCTHPRGFRKIA